MTSRFRTVSQDPELSKSISTEEESEILKKEGPSINTKDASLRLEDDREPLLLPKMKVSSENYAPKRQLVRRRRLSIEEEEEEGGKKKKRSFCRTWCDMWFLLSQSRVGCIVLNTFLFGGGLLIILLTALGGLHNCPELNGGVVFLYLVSALAITLGFLCCCYHFAQDNDDLPYGIFCVAYCLLFLFICITITGTVVVFTRIHPVGTDQPPPDMVNGTHIDVLSSCTMSELPFGVLLICYCLAVVCLLIAYCGCLLAFGARHIDD